MRLAPGFRSAVVSCLLLLFSTSGWSQDIDAALAAQSNGQLLTAHRLFRALALQGNGAAQFHLALTYADGKGVNRDEAAAYLWAACAVANANGSGFALPAASLRDRLAANIGMSAGDRAHLVRQMGCGLGRLPWDAEFAYFPERHRPFDYLLLSTGDLAITGMLVLAEWFGARVVARTVVGVYDLIDDWFPLSMTLMIWLMGGYVLVGCWLTARRHRRHRISAAGR
jgi:hypothetical protein